MIESISEVAEAVARAHREIDRANSCVSSMANLCVGRLRASGVSRSTLAKLKKELARYNIHAGRWSEQ
jgi:hypothetical protein